MEVKDAGMAMFTKISASLIVIAVVGVWGYVHRLSGKAGSNSSAIVALRDSYTRLKEEGTDVCKAHNLTDISVRHDMQHIQTDVAEVMVDIKAMHEQMVQSQLLQREILTKLEAMKGDQ